MEKFYVNITGNGSLDEIERFLRNSMTALKATRDARAKLSGGNDAFHVHTEQDSLQFTVSNIQKN